MALSCTEKTGFTKETGLFVCVLFSSNPICHRIPALLLFKYLFVRGNHSFRHLSTDLPAYRRMIHDPTHQIHCQPGATLLLRKIIERVLLIESMILPHQSLHLPDQITEDF